MEMSANPANHRNEIPHPQRPHRSPWKWAWIAAIAAFGLSVSCVQEEVDNDFWWHLKTGQYLIEHMEGGLPVFPKHDVFSQSGADKEWANHEWLSDMLMYAVYHNLGGLRTLIFLKSCLFISAFVLIFLFARERSGDDAFAGLVTILAVLTSQWTAFTRPPVFSYFFLAVYLHLLWHLDDRKRKPLLIWAAMSILMIFWVNLHGGAILGIVVTAIWMAGLASETVLAWFRRRLLPVPTTLREALAEGPSPSRYESLRPDWTWVQRFAPALALVGLASLANPFGMDIHRLTFTVMSDQLVVRTNSELQRPDLLYTSSFDAYAIILIAVIALLILYRAARFRIPDLLLIGFFLLQAGSHVRHLPLFAICAAAPLTVWLRDLVRPVREGDRIPLFKWNGGAARNRKVWLWLLVIVIVGVFCHTGILQQRFFRHVRYWTNEKGYDPNAYPEKVCDYILYAERLLGDTQAYGKFPDNMFNTVNNAGYLIWRLSPEHHKVFTDSRFDIHGSEYLRDVFAVEEALLVEPFWIDSSTPITREVRDEWASKEELVRRGALDAYWQKVLDRRNIGFIVIERNKAIAPILLNGQNGWLPVYVDPVFAIAVRDTTAYGPFINEARNLYLAQFAEKAQQ